jgi:hypothetical protein
LWTSTWKRPLPACAVKLSSRTSKVKRRITSCGMSCDPRLGVQVCLSAKAHHQSRHPVPDVGQLLDSCTAANESIFRKNPLAHYLHSCADVSIAHFRQELTALWCIRGLSRDDGSSIADACLLSATAAGSLYSKPAGPVPTTQHIKDRFDDKLQRPLPGSTGGRRHWQERF